MLKQQYGQAVPQWLAALKLPTPGALEQQSFPLHEVLSRSLYYPACGVDGQPVQFLAGFVHSFVYVDYGVGSEGLNDTLLNDSFAGYGLVGRRSLAEFDLAPNGWRPSVADRFRDQLPRFEGFRSSGFVRPPFAEWLVFDRLPDYAEAHGPSRFSLLYVGADGVAAYQALYVANGLAPEVLAIIQPGTGFRGNHTDFRDPNGLLAHVVLNAPARTIPNYLVYGGIGAGYIEACWPEVFPHHVEWFRNLSGNGVWARTAPPKESHYSTEFQKALTEGRDGSFCKMKECIA